MVESQNNPKKMMWTTLAMIRMGLVTLLTAIVHFDGTKVIFSWIVMFILYFVPYALMVGELGATFKTLKVVSSWLTPQWVSNGPTTLVGLTGPATLFIFK